MVNIRIKSAESETSRAIKRKLTWFLGLNTLAIFITGYLTYLHYKPSASTLCKINEYLDCDIVNKSVYAELFDIPVAIFGLLSYLVLFIVGRAVYRGFRFTRWNKWLTASHVLWVLFGITAFGTLFSLYLTYIEFFVLQAVCIFCLTQQIIILINLFILLSILSTIDRGKRENSDVCEFC